jgi:hypothetical protein
MESEKVDYTEGEKRMVVTRDWEEGKDGGKDNQLVLSKLD